MGLQKDITLDSGINLPQAYIKITSCDYTCNKKIVIKVNIYKDYPAYLDGKKEVISYSHICVTEFFDYFSEDVLNADGVNIISQSYNWLKTLDFYSDAIDVQEIK